MRIVAATQNAHKLVEIRAITDQFGFELVSQADVGLSDVDIEETGTTFEENSLIKAEAICRMTGDAAIADDSGLAVDALGGAPGVRSARYAGEDGNTPKNNALLLKNLEGVTDRRAQFTCAVALIAPDGTEQTVEGHCPGTILAVPAGNGGFGYDPLFVPDGFTKTFAELAPEEKNAISHRGRALAAAKKMILA